MRKQTKLVAVLSAAALLAMGASMTSFAAGWEKDDAGIWHYYDKDDEMVTNEWKKDGGKWFYLDDDGDMLVDSWVDDEYYVDESGAMLINQWRKTLSSEDVSDPDDDGDHWFYFGSNGKKIDDTHKRINGKTYYFNEDGEMRTGWYQDDTTGGAASNVYYLGEEDEGWRAENQWLWLERPTDDDDDDGDHWYDPDGEDCNQNCDDEGWYWFGSDGKMYADAIGKKRINGKDYYFNSHGQMLYEWINTKANDENMIDGVVNDGKASQGGTAAAKATNSDGDYASASVAEKAQMVNSYIVDDMRYANQVEDGSRVSGWLQIEGAADAGSDNDTDWYYFDDGEVQKADVSKARDRVPNATVDGNRVYRARIKCDGKYYCFNELGQMQDGLQFVDGYMYYFDETGNGSMKTGKISGIEEEDNDDYNYYFKTKSGGNGKGENGEKDGYLYWNGKRLEADDDYKLYVVDGKLYLVNNKGKIQKAEDKEYDLEGINEEDVTVEITKNSHEVKKVVLEGKKGGSDTIYYDKSSTSYSLPSLVAKGYAEIPMIAIYDNVCAPASPFSNGGGYGMKFYPNDTYDAQDFALAHIKVYNSETSSYDDLEDYK